VINGTASLYLASASPRRRELLDSVGVDYEVVIPNIDETRDANESPQVYVCRLAEQKAQAANELLLSRQMPANPILAADTIVVNKQNVFGKPQNQTHAFAMWQELANTEHHVMTAVALLVGDTLHIKCCDTAVQFGPISESQMQDYWRSEEPKDKAGGYAIQGLASAWVESIQGSYSGVVGLPLADVNELLKEVGLNWL